MPTVLWLPTAQATLSLVPTPSEQETKHRILVVAGEEPIGEIEAKQAGESTIEREDSGTEGPAQQFRQPGHRLAIYVQIDAGIFIGDFRHSVYISSTPRRISTESAKGAGGRRRRCMNIAPCSERELVAGCSDDNRPEQQITAPDKSPAWRCLRD